MSELLQCKELLPGAITELADLIGYDKTMALVKVVGGVNFTVPTGDKASEREASIRNAIGDDAAEIFMKNYGAEKLYLPRCHKALLYVRNQKFRQKVDESIANGMSQTAAIQHHAPAFGFTERWAYRVLEQIAQETEQYALFGEDV